MNKKGQALVEFVLILPILLMVLLAIIDIGNIFLQKYNLNNELDTVSTLYQNGKDKELRAYVSKENLSSKEIEELSNELIKTGKKLNITPNDLDKYLWEIGNRFCNKKSCEICPLRELCQTKKSVK